MPQTDHGSTRAGAWQRLARHARDCEPDAPWSLLQRFDTFFAPAIASPDALLAARVQECVAASSSPFDLVRLAAALLDLFMQAECTGPAVSLISSTAISAIPSLHAVLGSLQTSTILESLRSDGEEISFTLSSYLPLLALALCILQAPHVDGSQAHAVDGDPTSAWWKMRTLFVWQRMLENPSGTLRAEILQLATLIETNITACIQSSYLSNRDVEIIYARYWVEVGLIQQFYGMIAQAKTSFNKAQESTKLSWKVTGALGKRTKFQSFEVSQLVVIAESQTHPEGLKQPVSNSGSSTSVPETLALNDDTLLETTVFSELSSKGGNLRVVDQCILLAMCMNVKNSNPEDGLTTEQMLPFVTRVLENPNNWMVHSMALLLRSRLESGKSRTVQRSVLQLQALVDQMAGDHDSTAFERLSYIYMISVPFKWELESELADRFVSIGVVKSALEIYERLQLWDKVVSCLQMLERNQQAEEVVRKQLESSPDSPKLYCLLGDITKDSSHYRYAWEVSKCRYSRAMRSLGAAHFRKGEHRESVSCYTLALQINPLFENSWFVMGCAALRVEDWVSAEKAFRECVILNSDNGEAWTNLANVHLRTDRKREAWRCLREALRPHHDNSKIWDNYASLSVSLREFSEAVRAMRRVFDIRNSPARAAEVDANPLLLIDVGCLGALVSAVVHDVTAADGTTTAAATISVPLRALVGDVLAHSRMSQHPRILTLAAQLATAMHEFRRALDLLERAYRVRLHDPHLLDDASVFADGVNAVEMLADAYQELGPLPIEEDASDAADAGADASLEAGAVVCKDWRYRARTACRTFLGRTKAVYEGSEGCDKVVSLMKGLATSAEI
ncbi:hypothetical protein HDU83_004116 [Entophlyctis luteolus]|nr:hypothetical protein HDU83_004116 [Entophlyctis luteolus]